MAATDQSQFSLARILAGDHDNHIRTWGEALASWNRDVVLRFAHEMNGNWYPWGFGVQGNTPRQYVRAWHHVRSIFAAAGASSVRWCWAPNIPWAPDDTSDHASFEDFFPGPGAVDLLGIDGYNWASTNSGWTAPEELFGAGLKELRDLRGAHPIVVTETASSEGLEPWQSKAEWIRQLFDYLVNQPDVESAIWFHTDKEHNWQVDSSQEALAAYREAVASLRP